jgi:hypothetical protein
VVLLLNNNVFINVITVNMDSFSITDSGDTSYGVAFSRFIAGLSVLVGGFFLLSAASDIQLGFGLVLLSQGLMNITR